MKIPARYEHFVFGILQSGLTCLIAAGITVTPHAFDGVFLAHWLKAWLVSWLLMLPVVISAAPLIRLIVGRLTSAKFADS